MWRRCEDVRLLIFWPEVRFRFSRIFIFKANFYRFFFSRFHFVFRFLELVLAVFCLCCLASVYNDYRLKGDTIQLRKQLIRILEVRSWGGMQLALLFRSPVLLPAHLVISCICKASFSHFFCFFLRNAALPVLNFATRFLNFWNARTVDTYRSWWLLLVFF